MLNFKIFTEEDRKSFLNIRKGEKRIGEEIKVVSIENMRSSGVKYLILGAKEDIGVRKNLGVGGAHTNWEYFIKAFFNIQSNQFLNGQNIGILGYWEVDGEMNDINDLDDQLSDIVLQIMNAGIVPILIGGGHNNSFGMIKALSLSIGNSVNIINLDPHADLREPDMRHSGNGFSFAKKYGYLGKYFILGMHENYNNQYILDSIRNDDSIDCNFYEEIFISQIKSWKESIDEGIKFLGEDIFGVELDIDSIENALSSAMSPMGIRPSEAAAYLYATGAKDSRYLHIAEAVAQREDGVEQPSIGKLLSYLVQSFIKGKERE